MAYVVVERDGDAAPYGRRWERRAAATERLGTIGMRERAPDRRV